MIDKVPTGRKAEVTKLLKRANGVTVEQIVKQTKMLPHSARALLSGIKKTVKKPEKMITTKEGDKPTVYAIVVEEPKSKAA